nr:MAG TPA: hypothetical protein [Ackermannviridae sp.]
MRRKSYDPQMLKSEDCLDFPKTFRIFALVIE